MKHFCNLTDVRQTKEYAGFMQKIGWQAVCLHPSPKEKKPGLPAICSPAECGTKDRPGFPKHTYIYIKKLPLLPFSVVKILRSKKSINLDKLKKYKPLFIKIQVFAISDKNTSEVSQLTPPRWRIDSSPLLPTKTIWLDLTKSEKQLLSEIKKNTRYSIKSAQRKKLRIKIIGGNKITNEQLFAFYNLWKKNKPFNWLFKPNFDELQHLVESFKDKCFFVFIQHRCSNPGVAEFGNPGVDAQLLAGALILCSSNMSFYWVGCSSRQGKAIFAPTLCLWQAIKESKKRGLKIFDFEGIWDKRYPNINKGWKGFSHFKKGFGGKKIKFIPPKVTRVFNLQG